MTRERFVVHGTGDELAATKAGLSKTLELLGQHKTGVVLVPTMRTAKDTMLVTALGDLGKKFVKDRVINLDGGVSLHLCADATLKNFQRADVYLALWGSKYAIADIEALSSWKAAVLVTWEPAESAEWEQQHHVKVVQHAGFV